MNMDLSNEGANAENAPISFISDKMQTLQVPDTRPTTQQTCEYFKDGKLHFLEPKLRAENHPGVAEKSRVFRQFRMQIEMTPHLYQQSVEIPPIYLDLIAALVQDSDEPCTVLTSRINEILSPFLRNEQFVPRFDQAIEKAIKQVARKVTYGLKQEVYAQIEHTAPKIPWHLHIIRWEVDRLDLFPEDMQQAVILRRTARQNMTEVFSTFIHSLPANERSAIVNTKHRRPPLVFKEAAFPADIRFKQSAETEQDKLRKEEEKKKKEEEKKQQDEEKKQREEEKRKQREEEKKQREEEKRLREEEKRKREEEKKKKEQSQLRLTSLFTKSTAPLCTSHRVEKSLEPVKPTLFPSFYIKDHVTVSDINQCTHKYKSSYQDFKKAIQSSTADLDVGTFLSDIAPESRRKRGVSTFVDIRTLLLPGSADIMHVPNVRLALRMKLLQFHEDVRPAYYGTCTKRSRIVSGRKPFAKDIEKLDYDVDSEAEWEPEGEGEDIHSGDEDDDDPNTDMIDPEDAGWLVPEGYLSDSEGVEEDDGHDRMMGKSRSHNSSKRLIIRKIVLGPFFEGETEDEALRPFETHFFNDIPYEGYNPFYKEPTSRTPAASTATSTATTTNPSNPKTEFTNEHRDALISVINEKPKESIPNLITEAKSNWILKDVSKRQLEAKIKNIAVKEKRGSDTKPSWYIKDSSTPAQ